MEYCWKCTHITPRVSVRDVSSHIRAPSRERNGFVLSFLRSGGVENTSARVWMYGGRYLSVVYYLPFAFSDTIRLPITVICTTLLTADLCLGESSCVEEPNHWGPHWERQLWSDTLLLVVFSAAQQDETMTSWTPLSNNLYVTEH
jgi:hypothetical protein